MAEIEEFGKYLLLDHVAEGGMATIRRARLLNKTVIIKMIKKAMSDDNNYKTMFIDEIKNSFTLSHPNIAQILEYGERDSKLFCAMEFVDGKNLREYNEKLSSLDMAFPIDIALHVAIEVCSGLAYTHQFIDKFSGEKPNIIHRDISPQNIMISHDGSVKIIDFGIAKASTNFQSNTEVGTMKCNASYVAPEYIHGKELDHTYDQFSLGVVLWELLAGRRLFAVQDPITTLQNVQKCEVEAPSIHNHLVTSELDRILLKALSKEPSDRYRDVEAFSRDLKRELSNLYVGFNSSDLKHFANFIFEKEIEKERKHFGELYESSSQFKFIQETKHLKPEERKQDQTARYRVEMPSSTSPLVIKPEEYQTFKLSGNINKLQLLYSLLVSLVLGFILGEQLLKNLLRAWLFDE